MKEQELKKTYRGLIAGIFITVIIAAVLFVFCRFLDVQGNMAFKTVIYTMIVSVQVLYNYIYVSEYIYWIPFGPSYDDANGYSGLQRKKHAGIYLRHAMKMTQISTAYLIISWLLCLNMFIDVGVFALIFTFYEIKKQKLEIT